MKDRELMKQALNALFNLRWAASERDKKNRIRQFDEFMDGSDEAIEALRARLAQPEQEPWGYISHRSWKMPVFVEADNLEVSNLPFNNPDYTPVYKAPPQREFIGLTDEEIEALDCTTINASDWNEYEVYKPSVQEFARAIEAKLKAKNG